MTFTPEQNTALAAAFPPDRVSWRVGSTNTDKTKGMALAYIDARDVYDRLDAVVGAGGWQCRYSRHDKTTICAIGIKIGEEWVWKENGAGDSDIEAEKGALSDAVKRAAVVWGIGRYLYDADSPWVAIEGRGKSFAIKADEYPRLRAMLAKNAPEPTRKPSARPEPSPPQREAIKTETYIDATARGGLDAPRSVKVASDTNVTSGVQPPTADERAATALILQLSSCKTENEFLDVKGSEAFRKGRMALGEEQRKRLDETGKRLAARFPANPIAGG